MTEPTQKSYLFVKKALLAEICGVGEDSHFHKSIGGRVTRKFSDFDPL